MNKQGIFTFALLIISNLYNTILSSQTIITRYGIGQGFAGDGGPASLAKFNTPTGLAFDTRGNLYIADGSNIRIRKINAETDVISTIAGNGKSTYTGDGDSATLAGLYGPWGVVSDPVGNIYIADSYDNCIRKVNSVTGIITTIAGNGTAGFDGDGGPATSANLYYPQGIILDSEGNLYFSDAQNNRIRKITFATGVITTIAGNVTRCYSGDGGQAVNAGLFYPWGLALDQAGNLYIADEGNGRIRKVELGSGIISTFAGNGNDSYSGDGGKAILAGLSSPSNILFDSFGNLYIADEGNNRIRKVDNVGIISTVAGCGADAYSGDGGEAISAGLSGNSGMAIDPLGNLYFAEFGSCRIREIFLKGNNSDFTLNANIYPNPTAGQFYIETNSTSEITIQVIEMSGRLILNRIYTGHANLDLSSFSPGVYNVNISSVNQRINKRLVLIR